jgi:membrane-associated HD superfamily phosphohydrolase
MKIFSLLAIIFGLISLTLSLYRFDWLGITEHLFFVISFVFCYLYWSNKQKIYANLWTGFLFLYTIISAVEIYFDYQK